MRRLAVAAVTAFALASSAMLLWSVGGSRAQPTGIELLGQRSPSLLSLELLGVLHLAGTARPPSSLEESTPEACFREGLGRPCVRVCTRFVTARGCDRFSSPDEGCLRFVESDRSRCLGGSELDQPVRLPARP